MRKILSLVSVMFLVVAIGSALCVSAFNPASDYGVSYLSSDVAELMMEWESQEWKDYARAEFWRGVAVTSLVASVASLLMLLLEKKKEEEE